MSHLEPIEIAQAEAFSQLKPHCIEIARLALSQKITYDVNQMLLRSLEQLLGILQNVSQQARIFDRGLGDYIFYPLSHVFRKYQELSDRVVELCLECLRILILTFWRENIPHDIAKQLVILTTYIVDPTQQQKAVLSSEETTISALYCLLDLLKAICSAGIQDALFNTEECLASTGHLITILLTVLVESTSSPTLGSAAVEVLQYLLETIMKPDLIAAFLPGLVSKLLYVLAPANRSLKWSSSSISKSLDVLTFALSRTVADPDIDEMKRNNVDKREPYPRRSLTIYRDSIWLASASSQLRIALREICIRNRRHPNMKVRVALARLCEILITNCWKVLEQSQCSIVIIETCLLLGGDQQPEVRKHATQFFRNRASLSQTIRKQLISCIDNLITYLPRYLQDQDDQENESLINSLISALDILATIGEVSGPVVDLILGSVETGLRGNKYAHGEPFIHELRFLDGPDNSQDALIGHCYPECFMIKEIRTAKSLEELLAVLTSSSPEVVDRYVAHNLEQAKHGSVGSLWLLSRFLRLDYIQSGSVSLKRHVGCRGAAITQRSLYNQVLDFLVTFFSDQILSKQPGDRPSVVAICLALECLGSMAVITGKHFRSELSNILYPLLIIASSTSILLHRHATITMSLIAKSCEYETTDSLLLENIDYIVNFVTLQMNTFEVLPQVPHLLKTLITLAGPRIIPLLDDILDTTFGILDLHHGYEKLSGEMLGILETVVEISCTGPLKGTRAIEVDKRSMKAKTQRIAQLQPEALLERIAQVERPVNENAPLNKFNHHSSGNKVTESQDHDAVVNTSSDRQNSYSNIERISRSCAILLTHPSTDVKLKSLRIIQLSGRILGSNEERFLPLVNDIWPVLYERCFDQNRATSRSAVLAVANICDLCGEFLSSRVRDAWNARSSSQNLHNLLLQAASIMTDCNSRMNATSTDIKDAQWARSIIVLFEAILRNCTWAEEDMEELIVIIARRLNRTGTHVKLPPDTNDLLWMEKERNKLLNLRR